MKLTTGVTVRNRFDFVVTDALTGEVKNTFEAYNTITDYLLSRMVQAVPELHYIQVGSGVGEPAQTDVALFKYSAGKGCSTTAFTDTPSVISITKTMRLGADELVGVKLTEVGFSHHQSSGLMSHAMITDSEGLPIAITKTATDIIDIYATLYVSIAAPEGPLADVVTWGSYIVPGTKSRLWNTFFGTGRSTYIGLYEALGKGEFSGTIAASQTAYSSMGSTFTSVAGNYTRTHSARFTENVGNGAVRALVFGDMAYVDLTKPSSIWSGKTYTDVPVGIGDGVTTKFNLKHKDAKSLVIKSGGNVVPPESFTHNAKKHSDFVGGIIGYGDIPGMTSIVAPGVAPGLEGRRQHPTDPTLFSALDRVTRILYIFRVNTVTMTTEVLHTKVLTREEYPWESLVYLKVAFIGDGEVIAISVGGYLNYHLHDFNVATGVIGAKWTRHANMPSISLVGSDHENAATFVGIDRSPFALLYYTYKGAYGESAAVPNLSTFSLNKVTRVYGEQVNIIKLTGGNTIAIHGLAVHPTKDFLIVTTDASYFRSYKCALERATGLIVEGALVLTSNRSGSTQAQLVWDPSGSYIYVASNYYGDTFYSDILRYDELTDTITNDTAYIRPSNTTVDVRDRLRVSYGADNMVYVSHGNGNVRQIHMGALGCSLVGTFNGDQYAPYAYIANDKVVGLGERASSTALIPITFSQLEALKEYHLEFTTPPAEGATLVASYHVDYIPKDVNHVLDVSITYEYTGG